MSFRSTLISNLQSYKILGALQKWQQLDYDPNPICSAQISELQSWPKDIEGINKMTSDSPKIRDLFVHPKSMTSNVSHKVLGA